MGGFREIREGGGILTFGRPLGDGSADAFFLFRRTESGLYYYCGTHLRTQLCAFI